jgi:hypothetical protein
MIYQEKKSLSENFFILSFCEVGGPVARRCKVGGPAALRREVGGQAAWRREVGGLVAKNFNVVDMFFLTIKRHLMKF